MTLGRRFTLRERIGAGGMGTVWRAFDQKLSRTVAVKTLTGFPDGDHDELTARFEREARLSIGLSSPHIVKVHGSGRAMVRGRTVLYLVMEEVPGRSLDRILAERPTPQLDDVVRWSQDICAALEVAHAAGVVHRDLKPANVMVDDEGRAVVLDFGIARIADAVSECTTLTPTGVSPGTPAYMSPEQIRGDRDLDGRSDLYALGCMLHTLLTGCPPFTGGVHAVLHGHLDLTPESPRRHRPELPEAWSKLVLHLLAKDKVHRPPAASLVRQRLADMPTSPTLPTALGALTRLWTQRVAPTVNARLTAAAGGRAVPPRPSGEQAVCTGSVLVAAAGTAFVATQGRLGSPGVLLAGLTAGGLAWKAPRLFGRTDKPDNALYAVAALVLVVIHTLAFLRGGWPSGPWGWSTTLAAIVVLLLLVLAGLGILAELVTDGEGVSSHASSAPAVAGGVIATTLLLLVSAPIWRMVALACFTWTVGTGMAALSGLLVWPFVVLLRWLISWRPAPSDPSGPRPRS